MQTITDETAAAQTTDKEFSPNRVTSIHKIRIIVVTLFKKRVSVIIKYQFKVQEYKQPDIVPFSDLNRIGLCVVFWRSVPVGVFSGGKINRIFEKQKQFCKKINKVKIQRYKSKSQNSKKESYST